MSPKGPLAVSVPSTLGRAGALSSALTAALSPAGISALTSPYKTKADFVALLGLSTIMANDPAVAAIHHGSLRSPSTKTT